jgi:hypothetical protein
MGVRAGWGGAARETHRGRWRLCQGGGMGVRVGEAQRERRTAADGGCARVPTPRVATFPAEARRSCARGAGAPGPAGALGRRYRRRCPSSCGGQRRHTAMEKLRIGRGFGWGIAHGAFRDFRRFPSTRWYPVPRATRTTLGFGLEESTIWVSRPFSRGAMGPPGGALEAARIRYWLGVVQYRNKSFPTVGVAFPHPRG